MMVRSDCLCRALGGSGLYVTSLVRRLVASEKDETIMLWSLLQMLQLVHQHHSSPRQLVLDYNLYDLVKNIALLEEQVLVSQVSKNILIDFHLSTFS